MSKELLQECLDILKAPCLDNAIEHLSVIDMYRGNKNYISERAESESDIARIKALIEKLESYIAKPDPEPVGFISYRQYLYLQRRIDFTNTKIHKDHINGDSDVALYLEQPDQSARIAKLEKKLHLQEISAEITIGDLKGRLLIYEMEDNHNPEPFGYVFEYSPGKFLDMFSQTLERTEKIIDDFDATAVKVYLQHNAGSSAGA